MRFADAIYRTRANRNLSIRTAAKQAGVAFNSLYRIEIGEAEPSLVSFAKLCKWADLNPAEFLNQWSSRRTTQKG